MTLSNTDELVKLLTEDVKQQNQVVPWRTIAGFRDVAAHGYHTLRMEDVWETVITKVPTFLTQVKGILNVKEKSE